MIFRMTLTRVLICVFLANVGLLFPETARAATNNVIIPGESVAGVELGSHFVDFEQVFRGHPGADTDYSDNGCGERAHQWVDVDRSATGVYVYLKDDKISQI